MRYNRYHLRGLYCHAEASVDGFLPIYIERGLNVIEDEITEVGSGKANGPLN